MCCLLCKEQATGLPKHKNHKNLFHILKTNNCVSNERIIGMSIINIHARNI